MYTHESEFLQKLVKDKKIHEARAFNFIYRYIDDVLSINNSRFADIPKLWTNNNNESFNRNINANNNWKVLKLPVLIDRLSDMEQDQMTDITVVYPIRNGHFKMADCKSSKR